MIHEIYTRTALPPQICQIWVLGAPVIYLFIKVSVKPSYIYSFVYISPLYLNCTACKEFSDSIQSLFLITKFVVDACNFNINLITYSVVMHQLLGVFSDIINVYLALLCGGCNSLVKKSCEVK